MWPWWRSQGRSAGQDRTGAGAGMVRRRQRGQGTAGNRGVAAVSAGARHRRAAGVEGVWQRCRRGSGAADRCRAGVLFFFHEKRGCGPVGRIGNERRLRNRRVGCGGRTDFDLPALFCLIYFRSVTNYKTI